MRFSKPVILTLVAMVFVGVAVFLFRSSPPHQNRPTRGSTIVFFGDSLMEGVGASPGKDLASLVSRDIREPVINAGRAGDTTASALARLGSDVLSRDPKLVVILLSGNDAIRRVPVQETFKNIRAIISRIRDEERAVLLIGVQGGILGDKYRGEFRDLADDTEVDLVPDILDGVFGRPALMQDGIHPNDGGYALMAARISPIVMEILSR